jgi:hypothetical protein
VATLLATIVLLAAGAFVLMQERHTNEIQRELADAERLLALASSERDEQDRPRTREDRRELLLRAVAAASATIARDDGFALAWFVRARAHHRLQQYADAVYDLDAAERLRGTATPEILHFRIDALRQQGDAASVRRMQQDLTSLLQLDPSPHTRALVAELLLDYATETTGHERAEALLRVHDVLRSVGDEDPRAAVARARRLELDGAIEAALAAMRAACVRHDGNLSVHLQAAAMFDRHDLFDEGAREHEVARRLQPPGKPPAAATPLDLEGFSRFLGDVDRVLRAQDRKVPEKPPDERR